MKPPLASSLSVSRRLSLASGLVAAAILVVLGLIHSQLLNTQAAFNEIIDQRLPRVIQATKHVTWTTGTTIRIVAVNLSAERKLGELFGPQIDARLKQIVKTHDEITAWATTDEEKALLARNAQLNTEIGDVVKKMGAARAGGQADEAADIIVKSFIPLTTEADLNYERLADVQLKLLNDARVRANAVGQQRWWIALAALALLAALTVWLCRIGLSLRRVLGAEPLQVKAAVDAVRRGDLSADIPAQPGDSDSIYASMKAMRQSLVDLVTHVNRSAHDVAQTSVAIAADGKDLSDRTGQQAAALEQTAASMEQISATVRQNAESAQQANQHAVSAAGMARQGGSVVDEVVATMKDIDHGSKQMAEIIAVIDGIAFQTNILALNAAVEAARAGEQGRGFAVVAAEVRTLAQRSATSAKSIRALIASNVEKVEMGSTLVDRAGVTMREVVASIQRVAEIVAEISVANGEQTTGIEQVSAAVTDMDRSTQHNAGLVQAGAESATGLSRQARALLDSIAAFKV